MALPLLLVVTAVAVGEDFGVDWWTVDAGGDRSSGGGLEVSGTIGQPDAGVMTGGPFTLVGGFWAIASATVPGDCDGDGDVDLVDFGAMPGCLLGPDVPAAVTCACFDADLDADVDLLDFAEFQQAFDAW